MPPKALFFGIWPKEGWGCGWMLPFLAGQSSQRHPPGFINRIQANPGHGFHGRSRGQGCRAAMELLEPWRGDGSSIWQLGVFQGKCPDKPALLARWAQQESSPVEKGNAEGLNLPGRGGMGEKLRVHSRGTAELRGRKAKLCLTKLNKFGQHKQRSWTEKMLLLRKGREKTCH